MNKFSIAFKKKVAETYLNDELSLVSVASMYNISSSTVRKWAYIYREHGIETLSGSRGNHSADFKLMVVKDILDNQLSIREAAIKHKMSAFYTVSVWLEKYKKFGEHAFLRKNKERSNMHKKIP